MDGDPGAQGEGLGLDLDTRIFKFKEENEYDILAVRIGREYRKAAVREDTLIPSTSDGGTGTDGDSGHAGTADQNARGLGTRFGVR